MPTKYEYYTTGGDANTTIGNDVWFGQSITIGNVGTNEDHLAYSVKLIARQPAAAAAALVVGLRTASGGEELGTVDLCTGSLAADSMTSTLATVEIVFSTKPRLSASSEYALVIRAPGAGAGAYEFTYDSTSASYGGGQLWSSVDGGANWDYQYTEMDILFEEWGSSSSSSSSYSSSSSSSAASVTWSYWVDKPHGNTPNVLLDITTKASGSGVHFSKKKVTTHGEASVYSPKLISVSSTTHSVENWDGGSDTSTITVVLSAIEKGEIDAEVRRLREGARLINKEAEVKVHFQGIAYAQARTILKGKIKSYKDTLGQMSIQLADNRNKYFKTIPTDFYSTDTYEYLDKEQEGTVIPYLLGEKKNLVPTQIDTNSRTFKVSGLPLHTLTAVYDTGIEITPVSSSLEDATFSVNTQAFSLVDNFSTGCLLTIDGQQITTAITPASSSTETLGQSITDTRYNTVGNLVNYINTQDGYTASLICSGNIPTSRLTSIFDEECAVIPFTVTLQPSTHGEITCDAVGCYDTAAGKYTAVANATIERPESWIHFIANSICGLPDALVNATAFSASSSFRGGYKMGRYLTEKKEAWDVIQEISKETSMWTYWDTLTNKLTIKNADVNMDEATSNYYYEVAPYPKIVDTSLTREYSDNDIYNVVDIMADKDESTNSYHKIIKMESTTSQNASWGYGVTNNYKIESQWLPEDYHVANISYTGTGICRLNITGQHSTTGARLQTTITGGAGETEFDYDLLADSYKTLSGVSSLITLNGDYNLPLVNNKYLTLDSRGLADVDNKVVGDFVFYLKMGYKETGQLSDAFKSPQGSAVYGNSYYVVDRTRGELQLRDKSDLSYASVISGFNKPMSVCCNSAYIFVADTENHKVSRYSITNFGSYIDSLATLSVDEQYPTGLACDDSHLWIADTWYSRLVKVDVGASMEYASEVGGVGTGDSQFNQPRGITVDASYVYVCDMGNNRVKKHNKATLAFVSKYGTTGAGDNSLYYPYDCYTWGSAYLDITDWGNNRIVRRKTSDLSFVSKFGQFYAQHSEEPDAFYKPTGISGDSTFLYISDSQNYRIKMHYKEGVSKLYFSPAKMLGTQLLSQKKDAHERISFTTSLVGIEQPLGDVINVRRHDEVKDTRMRVTQVQRDVNNYKVTIEGIREGVPLNHLVGRWKMTQSSGADAPDTSGNGYTLTATGTPLAISGAAIINFNGTDNTDPYTTDNYYSLPHASVPKLDFTGTDPFTLVGRIYPYSNTAALDAIVGKWDDGNDQYSVYKSNNGKIYFTIVDGDLAVKSAVGTFSTINVWRTFAAVFDGEYLRLYVDGYLDESATNPLWVPAGITTAADPDFYIGYMPGYPYSCPEMYMDYLGVFDCALTYEEVMYVHEYWR